MNDPPGISKNLFYIDFLLGIHLILLIFGRPTSVDFFTLNILPISRTQGSLNYRRFRTFMLSSLEKDFNAQSEGKFNVACLEQRD